MCNTLYIFIIICGSGWLILIGLRNYRNPEHHSPISPLGRALSRLGVESPEPEKDNAGLTERRISVVRQEAQYFMLGGVLMLVTLLGTLFAVYMR